MVVYVSCRAGHPKGGFSCGFAAIHLLPYGMGKSINFTPALQTLSKAKKAPETGASFALVMKTGEGLVLFVLEQSTDRQGNLLLLVVDVDDLSLDNLANLERLPA